MRDKERVAKILVVQLGHKRRGKPFADPPKGTVMAACVPVRDMKNTAEFASLVDREGEVIVTKNGYNAFHCLSEKQYQLLQEEAAKAKLLSRILLAEEEIKNGEYDEYGAVTKQIRAEYGI